MNHESLSHSRIIHESFRHSIAAEHFQSFSKIHSFLKIVRMQKNTGVAFSSLSGLRCSKRLTSGILGASD